MLYALSRVVRRADVESAKRDQQFRRAIPLFAVVPALGAMARHAHDNRCSTWDCASGSIVWRVGAFFACAEYFVYFIHARLLHYHGLAAHHVHHAHRRVRVDVAYAFSPPDGFLQGVAVTAAYVCVPIPYAWFVAFEAFVGMWTIFIHLESTPRAPWPLLGPGYHAVHHEMNWYNFGFVTRFQDWLHGTLRAPRA